MDFERASVAVTSRRLRRRPPPQGEVIRSLRAARSSVRTSWSYFQAVTSISLAVRPKRSGRYMSSTLACGRIFAGRHRAQHDIGHGEDGRVVLLALEGRGEAIVAELGSRPARTASVIHDSVPVSPERHEVRVVDLEPRRQIIGDDHAAELRLRFGDLQHHHQAGVFCLTVFGSRGSPSSV